MQIIKQDEFGYLPVGDIIMAKKESKVDAIVKFFTGVSWVLFRNQKYKEETSMDFPNDYYRSIQSVPIYRAMKDGQKAGVLIPRISESGGRFLLAVVNRTNPKTMKKIRMKFYIREGFNLDWDFVKPTTILRKV